MNAENNVPAIRFLRFSEEWEEKALGGFVSNISDGDWIESNHIFAQGKYRIIQTGNLGADGEYIDKENNAKYFHQKDFDEIRANEIFPGDILISRLAEPAGRTIVLPNTGFRMVTAVDVTVIRPDNRFNSTFLKTQLNTANVLLKVSKNVSGTSHKRISRSNLEKTKLLAPNVEEQTKIGNYFQQLDTLIAQHQKKHDKLLNLKKALLEKMFPKQGTTVPEIRFKGFSGEWEEKQLEDLADIVRGASPRPIEDPKWFDKSSDVGWLRIRDVTEQGGRIYHLDQKISELGETKTRVLTENHLLLSIAASVGKPVINYVNTGVHDGFLIFKKPLFDLEYMFQWLKFFEEKWQQYGQPGSQVNLNSDIVKRQEVSMPKPEEQTKIGNLFKQLDTLLSQHQAQLKKLNNIKQACLAKMFV